MDLRKILLISLGHLSCDLNGGALPSLMPYLAAAHGFNYQAAGALMFAYSATSSLVQPVFGYLAEWAAPCSIPKGPAMPISSPATARARA